MLQIKKRIGAHLHVLTHYDSITCEAPPSRQRNMSEGNATWFAVPLTSIGLSVFMQIKKSPAGEIE